MLSVLRFCMFVLVVILMAGCNDTPVKSSDAGPTPAPSRDRGQIVGVVRDTAGKPIVRASIGLVKGPGPMIEMAALSDDRGEYAWPGLLPGEWTLSVHADGFKPQEGRVTVTASGTATLDFTLTPA